MNATLQGGERGAGVKELGVRELSIEFYRMAEIEQVRVVQIDLLEGNNCRPIPGKMIWRNIGVL